MSQRCTSTGSEASKSVGPTCRLTSGPQTSTVCPPSHNLGPFCPFSWFPKCAVVSVCLFVYLPIIVCLCICVCVYVHARLTTHVSSWLFATAGTPDSASMTRRNQILSLSVFITPSPFPLVPLVCRQQKHTDTRIFRLSPVLLSKKNAHAPVTLLFLSLQYCIKCVRCILIVVAVLRCGIDGRYNSMQGGRLIW